MKIAVYLGSNTGSDPRIKMETERLGEFIGKKHHTLVFGGGNTGLMNVISSSVRNNGGKVIGVELKLFYDNTSSYSHCDELHVTDTLLGRKQLMMKISDAFIALPGGTGTLDEITEIMCLDKLNSKHRPIFFLNIDGFYDDMKHQLEKMVAFNFLTQEDLELIRFVDDVEELSKEFKKL